MNSENTHPSAVIPAQAGIHAGKANERPLDGLDGLPHRQAQPPQPPLDSRLRGNDDQISRPPFSVSSPIHPGLYGKNDSHGFGGPPQGRHPTASTGSDQPADPPTQPARSRLLWLAGGLIALCLLALVLGAGAGSTGWDTVLHARHDATAWRIVMDIRLPRTLGAWLAGALLGLSGAVAQGLFRNPLADPYLLGSASGAALAVALAFAAFGSAGMVASGSTATLLQGASPWIARIGLTGAAFIGALVGVLLALILAQGVQQTLRLLLAGVVVGYVLGAVRDLVQLSYPNVLEAMQGFSLGVTGFVGWHGCIVMAAVLAPLALLAWALARVLDALSLGEATAQSLGLPLAPMRMALIAVLALGTGTAVAQTGLIGFVGLVAPHLARALARSTHGPLVLISTLVGGLLLMAADIAARVVIAPQELPVGVLTAVFGGVYLLWLMHRHARLGGMSS